VWATKTLGRHPHRILFLSRPNRVSPWQRYLCLYCHHEGSFYQGLVWRKSNLFRLPVVDTRGVALMQCTPAKACHLFKSEKARPKRGKLGLVYVQLCSEQEPDNQPLVAAIDPSSWMILLSCRRPVIADETALRVSSNHGSRWRCKTGECTCENGVKSGEEGYNASMKHHRA
jgi:hypothetical protein